MTNKQQQIPAIRFNGFTDAWEQRKLSNMTQYKNGKGHEDRQVESGKLELVNLNSISIDGGLKYSGKFVDEADETLMKDDLVMILSDVGHGDLLGRVALIPEDNRFVLNQRVALLRTNETANPRFLFSYINAHQYYFKSQGAGMSQLNISKGSVENFTGFVPSLSEQKQIGNFFKQLDDTIALHQRQLENYKQLKKSMLQKIFNQELRFKDQDGNDYPDWDEKKMGEIAKIRTGYTPPRKDKNNFGGDIIWISVADMKTKYIYDTKEYLSGKDVREAKWIEADTLIMSFKLSVGVLAITKIKCMSNEAIANFKWKNDITNNEYMYAYLSSQDISTYGNNASQGISLNNESLREIRVPVPCKEEQQKIAEFFTLLDKKVESVKKGVELLKEQKKGFMQQMFL